jgi:hypothetical protein
MGQTGVRGGQTAAAALGGTKDAGLHGKERVKSAFATVGRAALSTIGAQASKAATGRQSTFNLRNGPESDAKPTANLVVGARGIDNTAHKDGVNTYSDVRKAVADKYREREAEKREAEEAAKNKPLPEAESYRS